MQDRNRIDDLFRQRFDGFDPDFDKAGAWTDLEKRMDRKNKPGLFFFSIAGLLLLVMTVGFTRDQWGRDQLDAVEPLNKTALYAGQTEKAVEFGIDDTDLFIQDQKAAIEAGSENDLEKVLAENVKADKSSSQVVVKITADPVIDIHEEDLQRESRVDEWKIAEITGITTGHMSINTLLNKRLAINSSEIDFDLDLPKRRRKWSECKVEERSSFYFTPYVSGLYPFQSVSPVSDQDAYADSWKRYDEVLPGYATGLKLGYEHPTGLNLEAGLEWQQAFERLLFYQMVTETIRVYSDSAYYWENEQGEIEYFGDTITSTRTYERKVQSLKQHRIWSIPVSLGYTFDFNQLRLGVQLGAIFHLDHTFKGRVYTPEGNFEYLLPSERGKIYNPNLGVSWYGSLRMYFLPSDNMEWYIAPGFRFNRSSWLNADSGLDLVNQFGELQLGVRIFF
jgi:hypothetical protein